MTCGAPVRRQRRTPLQEPRAGEHHDEAGEPGDGDEVLEEAEQPVVGVLGVVDDQRQHLAVGDPLEEDGPGAEEVLAGEAGDRAGPEQGRHPVAQPVALAGVRHVALQSALEQLLGGGVLLVVVDPGEQPAPDGLGQREVGHALAVGHAPSAVPADELAEPVDVLLELPGQPGLADSGLAVDDQQRGTPGLLSVVEQLLDQPQLAVAPDQGRLEAVGALRAAGGRDDRAHRPERHRVGLALEGVGAGVNVRDGGGGQQARGLVDPDLTRGGGRLHTGGGVDGVAGDHALLGGAGGDRDLAGDHADAQREVGCADVVAELAHRRDQLEPGAHGPFGVVLVGGRHAPHGHHGVADELLDRAAVAGHDLAALVEVAAQQLAHVLGVARLGQRGEPDQVTEQDASSYDGSRHRWARTGAGCLGCAGALGPAAVGVPHSAQNLAPGVSGLAQATQAAAAGVPHSGQNFPPGGRAASHAAHRRSSVSRPALTPSPRSSAGRDRPARRAPPAPRTSIARRPGARPPRRAGPG